jgi:hypothetical protein
VTNTTLPAECIHVRTGSLKAIEELHAITLPGHDEDFRYVKGPDVMRICPYCAGMLWSVLTGYPFSKATPTSERERETAEDLYPVGVGLMRMVQRHAEQRDAERAARAERDEAKNKP